MTHYVLTRSSYGPDWPLDANRRRLGLTEGITAKMMSLQTHRAWTWIVLLDERDPLLQERLAVFQSSNVDVKPLFWAPDANAAKLAEWDKNARLFTGELDEDQAARSLRSRVAATAYKVDWSSAMSPGRRLMTRLDDDDALTADALERTVKAALRLKARTVLMQPTGYRVWDGRQSLVHHPTNAMHSLLAPSGDSLTVYDYGHRKCDKVAPVVRVDLEPAWLWVRHPDTLSGWKKADRKITSGLKRLFPIDWSLI